MTPQAAQSDESFVDWRPIWEAHSTTYDQLVQQMAPANEAAVHRELLFCLLGGHAVSYELALSATERCAKLDVFALHWAPDALKARLADELSQPQFLPRKLDGTLRRYRYPERKAILVVGASQWLASCGSLTEALSSLDCEQERRKLLCACPGIGPKTASWLLRNLGFAQNLAVLDVHVLRAMVSAGLVGRVNLSRDYEMVEETFLAWCEDLAAPPAAFDLFLWEFQRGRLSVVA